MGIQEQMGGIKERGERSENINRYIDAIDLMFGLKQDVGDPEEKRMILERGNEAAVTLFDKAPGEVVYLNESIVQKIEEELGQEETRRQLGKFKDELEDKKHSTQVSERVAEDRDMAKEKLFKTRNVKYVTFG